jgi:FMN phosphatase YigB (HAD superfamily)
MSKSTRSKVVFLFDVDNTLLDNDRVREDLKAFLRKQVGARAAAQYWVIFERLRKELGYADYLGALQRCRIQYPHDLKLLEASRFLVDYPFANRLYPNSLDAIEHVARWGPAVILSDGDIVFQPRKVHRSGIFETVRGCVLIYIHKEKEMREIQRRFPADHYVLIDDKLRILTAFKKAWGKRITTVFPRQGHYANDPKMIKHLPPADITIQCIGDLLHYDLKSLLSARRNG